MYLDICVENLNSVFVSETVLFPHTMAEQEYEQRMRELQRAYVEFLDDSDRDGIYDRLVV